MTVNLYINSYEVAEIIKAHPGTAHQVLVEQMEKAMFKEVLILNRGNQSKAASALGINRGNFRKKLKTHGMLR